VTYHLYGGNASRPKIRDFAHSKGLPTGQTEFMGTTINHLYGDLTEGGVSVWEHYVMAGWGNTTLSGCYLSANHNRTSFSRYPHYWDFRQVMHYVRPGAVRVEAASDDPAIRPLAFARDGKMAVVLLNNTPPHQPRTVELKGILPGAYRTCGSAAGKPYQEFGPRGVQDAATLSVEVPPNSVLTLYPFGPQYPAPVLTDWRATPNFLTTPRSAVTLSASATSPDLKPIAFEWSVERQPAGAQVSLAAPKAASTQASGLTVPGDYVFAVTGAVSDPALKSVRKVRLTVFDGNQPPEVVDLHNRIPLMVTLPRSTTLLRGGGRDLEGDKLTLRWSIASQPAGAQARIEEVEKKGTQLANLTVAGEYVVQLEVSDPTHTVSEQLKIKVYPPNKPPAIESAAANPARLVPPESKTALSAKTSDPDGDAITHWWSVQRAPAGAKPVFEKQGSPNTAVSGLAAEGTYVFTLTVVDRTLPTRSNVTVVVGKESSPAQSMQNPLTKGEITARGTLVGTIAAKGPAWIEISGEGGKTQRYIPDWRGGMPHEGGGPDPEVGRQIQSTKIGDRIRVRWHRDHHLRVEQIDPAP